MCLGNICYSYNSSRHIATTGILRFLFFLKVEWAISAILSTPLVYEINTRRYLVSGKRGGLFSTLLKLTDELIRTERYQISWEMFVGVSPERHFPFPLQRCVKRLDWVARPERSGRMGVASVHRASFFNSWQRFVNLKMDVCLTCVPLSTRPLPIDGFFNKPTPGGVLVEIVNRCQQ